MSNLPKPKPGATKSPRHVLAVGLAIAPPHAPRANSNSSSGSSSKPSISDDLNGSKYSEGSYGGSGAVVTADNYDNHPILTAEQLRARILASFARAQDLGCHITIKQTAPTEVFSFPAVVAEALQERRWDGFIVGFGIRGVAEYTEVFEQLVNAARVLAPTARIGFNTRPDNLDETLKRMFGVD